MRLIELPGVQQHTYHTIPRPVVTSSTPLRPLYAVLSVVTTTPLMAITNGLSACRRVSTVLYVPPAEAGVLTDILPESSMVLRFSSQRQSSRGRVELQGSGGDVIN